MRLYTDEELILLASLGQADFVSRVFRLIIGIINNPVQKQPWVF